MMNRMFPTGKDPSRGRMGDYVPLDGRLGSNDNSKPHQKCSSTLKDGMATITYQAKPDSEIYIFRYGQDDLESAAEEIKRKAGNPDYDGFGWMDAARVCIEMAKVEIQRPVSDTGTVGETQSPENMINLLVYRRDTIADKLGYESMGDYDADAPNKSDCVGVVKDNISFGALNHTRQIWVRDYEMFRYHWTQPLKGIEDLNYTIRNGWRDEATKQAVTKKILEQYAADCKATTNKRLQAMLNDLTTVE